jgi:hypothetical protein
MQAQERTPTKLGLLRFAARSSGGGACACAAAPSLSEEEP